MSLTNTTLATAMTINDTQLKVTSATGFAVRQKIRVDNEWMEATAAPDGTFIKVRRGLEGTAQVAHGVLADVVTADQATDWPDPGPGLNVSVPPFDTGRATLGVDTTFAAADYPRGQHLTYVITKAGVCAIVLGNPSKAQNGMRLTFRSATANAHTLTYTAGIYGDTTSSDVLTFAAKVGASCTLEANGGLWGAIALTNVTAA
jgi:hypothetical protein